jgi:hypothetical protein
MVGYTNSETHLQDQYCQRVASQEAVCCGMKHRHQMVAPALHASEADSNFALAGEGVSQKLGSCTYKRAEGRHSCHAWMKIGQEAKAVMY